MTARPVRPRAAHGPVGGEGVVLGARTPRHGRCAAREHQRFAGAGEHFAERGDRAGFGFHGIAGIGEVVVERQVDDAVGVVGRLGQDVKVGDVAAQRLGAEPADDRGRGIGSRQPHHVMTRRGEF